MNRKLDLEFFSRDADEVARDLLGKIIVRKIGNRKLNAKIVETEAYFGPEDPASRAVQNGDLRKTMLMRSGTILVYGVHNSWLLNFVTRDEGRAEAVLIRALEPLDFEENLKGPGLLTKGLGISKDFHKKDVVGNEEFWLEDNEENIEIVESFRIGVSKDLPKKMRFYIKENKHVSRK